MCTEVVVSYHPGFELCRGSIPLDGPFTSTVDLYSRTSFIHRSGRSPFASDRQRVFLRVYDARDEVMLVLTEYGVTHTELVAVGVHPSGSPDYKDSFVFSFKGSQARDECKKRLEDRWLKEPVSIDVHDDYQPTLPDVNDRAKDGCPFFTGLSYEAYFCTECTKCAQYEFFGRIY